VPQFRAAVAPSVRWCAATPSACRRRSALALKHALSAKDGGIIVIDKATLKDAKTKALAKQFDKPGLLNALIIDGAECDANFCTAARNIPNIDVLPIQGINVYDIMRRKTLVLTKAALDALEARFK
jgi:large subunit ribosomal protein L4